MPTTRLAAIMFTDIVGYTAMMQRNQAEAMTAVKGYETVLKARIQAHGGDLLQTYGDGSLSIFDSASAAVLCAKEIQEEIRGKVPLRIGIHLGEITIDGDHTFGDGVNIASRVESMGIAGAVLLSSSIRQQIKNRPEFTLTSLGKFSFKNVAEPMTVYALANEGFAVPKPEEMKGKGKKIVSERSSPKSWVRMASVGFVAMVVGAAIFWITGMQSSEESKLLDKDIREAKVAVNVFENFTGDENLDALGYMASEWASSGLRELKVRTVSPEIIRQNKDAIGILPDNPQNKPSFAEITGADYVVTGSYFLKGDSIVLNTRLSSAIDGEEVNANFPQIVVHKDQKEQLVEDARQYLLSYWVLEKDLKLPPVSPPKLIAYETYLTCLANDPDCYQKAIDLDPNFLLARVLQMGSCNADARDSVFHLDKEFVEKRWKQCTEFEKLWYYVAVHMWENNREAWLHSQEAIYRLDPNDYYTLHQAAFSALAGNNRPSLAIEMFDYLFDNMEVFGDRIVSWSYEHYMDALNRTESYDKLISFYHELSPENRAKAGEDPIYYYLRALISQNRMEEVFDFIESGDKKETAFLKASYIYQTLYPNSDTVPFNSPLSQYVKEFSTSTFDDKVPFHFIDGGSQAIIFYLLGQWENAKEVLLGMSKYSEATFDQPFDSFPTQLYWEKLYYHSLLGCIYAKLGSHEESEWQIQKLEELSNLYDAKHAIFHRGIAPYLIARIYANLGEKEIAVEYLRKSVEEGRLFGWWWFSFDLDFTSLKGYPPFEELIKPKG